MKRASHLALVPAVPPPQATMPFRSIRVGPRHRQDLGDLSGLAASIATYGLIHPVVVRADGQLISGRRRLEAWRLARGADEPVPVHVFDIDSLVAGEYDENVFRKDLTPSELVALMRELTPAIREVSRVRQAELGKRHGGAPPPPLQRCYEGVSADPEPWRPGRTTDKVARLLGVSARTLAKASAVVDAATAEPERFGRHLADMDRTGKVHGPYKRLVNARQAEAIRAEPPALPGRGPYRVIVADPPWPFDPDREDQSERGTHPYPLMTYAQIRALDVPSIAHEHCVLWLWTTNHHLRHAYSVVDAWGFQDKTVLTWVKDKIGRGQYLREKTEHCIMAVRGRPTIELFNESTEIQAARLEHSRKPDAFYTRVEAVCPAPAYAALFAHGFTRTGWDTHSTEAVGAPAPLEEAA